MDFLRWAMISFSGSWSIDHLPVALHPQPNSTRVLTSRISQTVCSGRPPAAQTSCNIGKCQNTADKSLSRWSPFSMLYILYCGLPAICRRSNSSSEHFEVCAPSVPLAQRSLLIRSPQRLLVQVLYADYSRSSRRCHRVRYFISAVPNHCDDLCSTSPA